MKNFDLICTATLRPELIKQTFDSHIKHLFHDHIRKARLVVNIDMVGSENPEGTLSEILAYFDSIPFRDMTLHVSHQPHFGRAFNWCLRQIYEPLTFNLEEDWALGIDLDFEEMGFYFDQDPDLVHLRLSMFESKFSEERQHYMKTWNKFVQHNGRYFSIKRDLRGTIGWAGHPSLNKTSFLMGFGAVMDPEKNHEKQIKGHRPIILNSHFGVFHPKNTLPAIKDIGREWMNKMGYQKKGIKAFFTEWEKI